MKHNGQICMAITILVVLAFVPISPAQQGNQGGGNSSGGAGNTTGGSRGNVPTPQPSRPQTQRQLPSIIFITGAVVMEDGRPLPTNVTIERTCNGRTRREVMMDSTGHFSFQIGGEYRMSNLIPDASESYYPGNDPFGNVNNPEFEGMSSSTTISSASLAGCDVRASAAGYRSTAVNLAGGPLSGNIDIGTIVLHPLVKVPGSTISATSMMAPKAARKELERARKDIEKKKFDKAEPRLKHALEIYSDYAEAWYSLGLLYHEQKRDDEAHAAYERALEIDKMFVSPYIQLALLAGLKGQWQEVVEITDHALALDPIDFPLGYFYNAVANYNLNDVEASERSALKLQRMDGLHRIPQVYLLLADICERRRDTQGTMEHLQNYLKYAAPSEHKDQVRARLTALERATQASTGQPAGASSGSSSQ